MSLTYSLSLLLPRDRSASLLESLASRLDADSRARIDGLVWQPETESERRTSIGTLEMDSRGIAGLIPNPDKAESANSFCFSLEIQLELEMQEHLTNRGFECFSRPAAFGCMYTSFLAGRRYLSLDMTAANSGMSRTLRDSHAIHDMWIELARETKATFAFVNLDDDVALQLFPKYGDLVLPDTDPLCFDGDYHCSIDLFTQHLLATNCG